MFFANLGWLHIVPEPQVHRVTQLPVVRPFREADLRHQRGLHPVRPLVGSWLLPERTGGGFERLQQGEDRTDFIFAEPGAGVADVDQVALLVHAEQQRAESLAGPARLGPAADDEFLFEGDLQLPPVGRPVPGAIARVEVLCDQAFPAAVDRALVEGAAVGGDELAQAQQRRTGIAEHPLEAGPARRQRQPDQILGAVAEDVERDERDRRRAARAADVVGAREVDPSLELLKPRRFAGRVERHQLAVEDDTGLDAAAELPQGPGDLRELGCLVVAKPRIQVDRALAAGRFELDDGTNAIVFRLVDEVLTLERHVLERGEHRAAG